MRYLKDEEPARVIFLLILLFILYNFVLAPLGFLSTPSLRTNDFFSQLSRSRKTLPKEIKEIVIVAVDNDSLKEAGLQWPWKRSVFAELVNRISSSGPKAIFLDFTFLGKSADESSDLLLAQSIKKAGCVILAGYIDEYGEFVKPLDIFSSAAQGTGIVNKNPDSRDLRVRQMRAVLPLKGKRQAFDGSTSSFDKLRTNPEQTKCVEGSLTINPERSRRIDYAAELKIMALSKGIPVSNISAKGGSASGGRYAPGKITLSPELSFPIDDSGIIPINYSAGADDFISVPAYKILGQEAIERDLFKDKIVMVGMTANIIHDIHPTPLGSMPGIYINANSLLMLLSGSFLKILPYWYGMFIFLAVTLAIGFSSLRFKAAYSALILAVALFGVSAVYLFLQVRYNFRMDIFGLIFLSLSSCLTVETYKYVALIIESEKLRAMAIIDPLTEIYTQRYFQLKVQSVLQKSGRKPEHLFCLMRINEFAQLSEKYSQGLPHLVKMLYEIIKDCLGKKALIARYQEDALSLCIWNAKRKLLEKSLTLLISEISNREFIVDSTGNYAGYPYETLRRAQDQAKPKRQRQILFEKEALKISVRLAALDFPRGSVRNYPDLILTCEAMLKRIEPDAKVSLAVFDSRLDRVISSSSAQEPARVMPESELGYVSLDLEARNRELEAALEELKKKEKEIARHYFYTMHSLVKALEEKDRYTAGHSERVGFYATALALGMNLPKEETEAIQRAAYLHDIGKIGLPDKILHKKEKLDDAEFEFVKRHQADGAKILEGLPFFEEVLPLILHHHERYDGRGYPYGLSGEMIPRGAQIIAVADSFDAMTTGRGYNKPLMLEEAIRELKNSCGAQFHPAYVSKFIELLEQKKIHAL